MLKGHIFDVHFQIDEEILNGKILKLLLQPIIENSIKHGIPDIEEKGVITVSGLRCGETVVFDISDNGKGIDQKKAQRLLEGDLQQSEQQLNSLGLYSINQRIKIQYGNTYGLTIFNRASGGVNVRIVIPYRKGDNRGVPDSDR